MTTAINCKPLEEDLQRRRRKMVEERIVCAAVEFCHSVGDEEKKTVIVGARHFDAVMKPQIELMWEMWGRDTHSSVMQGFITNTGRFVTRTEAKVIAESQRQLQWLAESILDLAKELTKAEDEEHIHTLKSRKLSKEYLLISDELFSEALY